MIFVEPNIAQVRYLVRSRLAIEIQGRDADAGPSIQATRIWVKMIVCLCRIHKRRRARDITVYALIISLADIAMLHDPWSITVGYILVVVEEDAVDKRNGS